MRSRIGEIEKERFLLLLFDETNGLVGKLLREQAIFKGIFNELITTPKLLCLVIALFDIIALVKSLLLRLILRKVPEMPFSHQSGLITLVFEDLRDRQRFRTESFILAHLVTNHSLGPTKACWVSAGQQSHARGSTNGGT